MLQEISRHLIKFSKYEEIDFKWHNNVLTILCDSGLYLLDFSYNLNCLDEKIDFIESKIKTSRTSPATDLFPVNALKLPMRNMDFTQMISDPALWPHSSQLMDAVVMVAFEWSPVDFIHNNESVVATLNSVGNIDIHGPHRHSWVQLENLSQIIKQEMDKNNLIPSVSCDGPINLIKVREAAYALESSALCWSPILNSDKSCYFVTAQKYGYILFWLLKYDNNGIDAKLEKYVTDNTEEIITMKWIQTSNIDFILLCSNITGQIVAYEFQIEDTNLKHLNTHFIWNHRDKMVAQYIEYEFLNEYIVIAFNKNRHLILQIIDSTCKVLAESIAMPNDRKISAVARSQNHFYVSTVNCELFQVKYVFDDDILEVKMIPIEVKNIPTASELHSFAFATNDTMIALALFDRTIMCRKKPLTLDVIIYGETSTDADLATIVNNPTKTLNNMWDVIEALRCKTLKSKAVPVFDYEKLYKDAKSDIYFARVFLIVLNFYKNLETVLQNRSKGALPEVTFEEIKDTILTIHAVKLMQELYETNSRLIVENKFEYECFVMAGIYLDDYCTKTKRSLDELLTKEIVDIFQKMKSYLKYTCMWCDETLQGFSCKNGHLNMFCALTFTLIESNNYFVCKCCDATVRSDLYLNNPKCLFCDLFLCHCYIPS